MKKLICKTLILTIIANCMSCFDVGATFEMAENLEYSITNEDYQSSAENFTDDETQENADVLTDDETQENIEVLTDDETQENADVLTYETQDTSEENLEIKFISVNIGATKSELTFSWHSNSTLDSFVVIDGVEYIAQKSEELKSNEGFFKYFVTVKNISATTISYKVGNENLWSDLHSIKSSADDNTFSFLLAGDPQIGSSGVASDGKGWATTLNKAENWFGNSIDFLLTTGDQVEASRSGYAEDEYEAFFAPSLVQKIPFAVNVGNHEVYTYSSYSDHFTLPSTMDSNTTSVTTSTLDASQTGDYWFEYEGTLFMSLNTNNLSNASHIEFMRNAIAEYTAIHGDPQWQIVTFHQSIYSSATHSSNATLLNSRIDFADVFSELNIDAVLMGHDHVYTRSVMMQGLIPTSTTDNNVDHNSLSYVSNPKAGEVLYLTLNSSSGSKYYSILDAQYDYIAFKNQEDVPNITKVDVSNNSLVFTTYRTGENNTITDIVDTFSIIRTSSHTSNQKPTQSICTKDVSAPVLNYTSEVTIYTDEDFDIYSVVSATDTTFNENGEYITEDLTDSIIHTGNIDTKKAGTYEITFYVSDLSGNTSKTSVVFNVKTRLSISQTGSEWNVYSGEEISNWNLDAKVSENWSKEISPFATLTGSSSYLVSTFDIEDIEIVELISGTVDNYKNTTIYLNGNEVAYTSSRGQSTNNFETSNVDEYLKNGTNILAAHHDNTDDFAFDLISFEIIMGETLQPQKSGNSSSANVTVQLESQNNTQDEVLDDDILVEQMPDGEILDDELLDQEAPLKVDDMTDVFANAWYYNSVSFVLEQGLFTGITQTEFSPLTNMSRAMLWTVLHRLDGKSSDNDGLNWYSNAQNWAIDTGISDGSNPNDDMTREQLVTILYRFKGEPAILSSQITNENASDWALDALTWAVDIGLLEGDENNNLNPSSAVSRAEVSTILMRLINS